MLGNFSENRFARTVQNMLVYADGRVIFHLYDSSTKEGTVRFYSIEDRKFLDPHTKIYGYIRTGDNYIINELEAKAVRMIYDEYLNGTTISEISRQMESLCYHRKRGKFSRKMVLYILSNLFYTGTRIYPAAYSGTGKEEIIENDHAAIISKDVFEQAQERREKYVKRH